MDHSEQYGDGILRNILKSFDILSDMPYSSVGPAIALCGITRKWLKNFFDFSFDVYKHNLFRQDNDRKIVVSEFEEIFATMKHDGLLTSSDDSFETKTKTYEADGKEVVVSGKKYKLSRFTQSAIKNLLDTTNLSEIGATCVDLIAHYDNLESIGEIPSYFRDAYEEWKRDYDKRNERASKESGEHHSNPHLVLAQVSGVLTPVILPPQRKVSDKYSPNKLRIRITDSNGRLIVDEITPYVIDGEVIGGFVIGADPIPIKDIFGGVYYELVEDGEVLHSWDLSREIAFFNSAPSEVFKGAKVYREVKPGNDFNGEIVVLTPPSPVFGLEPWKQFEKYWLSEITVSSENTYRIGDKYYSFCKTIEPGLHGEIIRPLTAKVFGIQYELPVYKNVTNIVAEVGASTVSEIALFIDGEKKSSNTEIVQKTKDDSCIVNINIPSLVAGLHKVSLKNSLNEIASFEFFLMPDFSISHKKIGNSYFCEVHTCFGDFEERFSLGQAYILIDLSENLGRPVTLKANTSFPLISLDGQKWGGYGSRVSIDSLRNNEYKLRAVGYIDPVLDINNTQFFPVSCEDGVFQFALESIASYSSSVNEMMVFIQDRDRTLSKSLVFYVDFATYISQDSFEAYYDAQEDRVFIKAEFSGSKAITCKILKKDGSIVYESPIESEVPLCLELPSCEHYDIQLLEKDFLSSKILRQKPLWFFRRNDLATKVKTISSLVLAENTEDDAVESERMEKPFDWFVMAIEPTDREDKYTAILNQKIKDDSGTIKEWIRKQAVLFINSSNQSNEIRAELVSMDSEEQFVYDENTRRLLDPDQRYSLSDGQYRIKAVIINT